MSGDAWLLVYAVMHLGLFVLWFFRWTATDDRFLVDLDAALDALDRDGGAQLQALLETHLAELEQVNQRWQREAVVGSLAFVVLFLVSFSFPV